MIKTDIKRALDFISEEDILNMEPEIQEHYEKIFHKTGEGNQFLGWTTLPQEMHRSALVQDINKTAAEIRQKAEVFVVVGIGGSYLGARAVIEALKNSFPASGGKKPVDIVYAGHQMSEDYMAELLDFLEDKEYALTVISKSGTTTEPAIAFRLLRQHLENKYGKQEARKRIIAITDKEKGALKTLSNREEYKTYKVPDDVGGRYSVLTPVGLLPIAVAGFSIDELLKGAADMQTFAEQGHGIMDDPAALYAVARNSLYRIGKPVEIMVNYQPKLYYFTEWWKQLFGESEGKQQRGIFPAGVGFTTDLHSMGQYIQEGLRILFETVISVEEPARNLTIPKDKDNLDGLNYIAGKRLEEVNKQAELATMLAHSEGGVPNIKVSVPKLNAYHLGELIYFYEMACALSGYILDVNPFNQPGVEAYKKNMFALLGKPGFEEEAKAIRKKI